MRSRSIGLIVVSIALGFTTRLCGQSGHSVGVPHPNADSIEWRVYSGMGFNFGNSNVPKLSEESICFEAPPVFYSIDLRSSSGSISDSIQSTLTELDMLIGFGWRTTLPLYHAPPIRLYFAFAMGVGVQIYSHPAYTVYNTGFGNTFSVESKAKERIPAFPLEFLAMYELAKNVGVGPLLYLSSSAGQSRSGGALMIEGRF